MRSLTAILVLAATGSAFAASETSIAGEDLYRQRPGGAEVYYASYTTTVDNAGTEHDLESGRMMLDYAESANSWLYLGFGIGLTFDNMQSEPLITDSDPAGYAFGVFVGARFLEIGPFAMTAEARQMRVYNEGTGSAQESVLHYSETTGRLGAMFRFKTVELSAGAFTLGVDGDLESTGGVVGTATFAEVESTGVYGGVRVRVDGGYALGLRAESGARESLAFTFTSRF